MSAKRLANERSTAFLVRRVRLGLGLLLFSVAAFSLADVLLAGSSRRAVSWIEVFEMAAVATAFLAVRGKPPRIVATMTALAVLGVFCLTTALTGALQRDTTTTPLLLIVLTLASATLLPWGFRRQMKLVLMALLATTANLLLVQELTPLA